MKHQLEARIDSMQDSGMAMSMQESLGELSSYDNHPGDIGSELFERSKDLSLLHNNKMQLKKVEDALKRMDQGSYGVCAHCGRPIEKERLEAVPETTRCIRCDNENFRKDYTNPGLARKTFIKQNFVEKQQMDAEDTWQDLARWNEHAYGAGAGSYYGGTDLAEDRGIVEAVEGIPYIKGKDGTFYEDVYGHDDEAQPEDRSEKRP